MNRRAQVIAHPGCSGEDGGWRRAVVARPDIALRHADISFVIVARRLDVSESDVHFRHRGITLRAAESVYTDCCLPGYRRLVALYRTRIGGVDVFRARRTFVRSGNAVESLLGAHPVKTDVALRGRSVRIAALEVLNAERSTPIKICRNKYLNNITDQSHLTIQNRTRPMLGLETLRCAWISLAGIEFNGMNANGQMKSSR